MAVVIQDMVVATEINPQGKLATGEFGNPVAHGGNEVDANEDPNHLIRRMFDHIQGLTNKAAVQHLANNCVNNTNQLKQGAENYITRLATNEFYFYTKKPLTIKQFEELQNQIAVMAKSKPENLQLILGSFSVKTEDSKVMNVVSHVECGPNPKIHLIVKNNPVDADPKYKEEDENKNVHFLPNVSAASDDISKLNIKIIGQPKPVDFSFNNVLICKTAGGEEYYSCVDICADIGLAKKNVQLRKLDAKINNLTTPELCSQVIISGWINPKSENIISGHTQADPVMSHAYSKPGVTLISTEDNVEFAQKKATQSSFGTPAKIILTTAAYCTQIQSHVLNELNYVANDQTFLDFAIDKNASAYVASLLQSPSINLMQPNSFNNTPLQLAALKGNIKMFKLVFDAEQKKDIPINEQYNSGYPAFHMAAKYGHAEIVKFLLEKNADVNTLDKSGRTPLYYAVVAGKDDMVKLLLAQNPKLDGLENIANIKSEINQLLTEHKQKINVDVIPSVDEKQNVSQSQSTSVVLVNHQDSQDSSQTMSQSSDQQAEILNRPDEYFSYKNIEKKVLAESEHNKPAISFTLSKLNESSQAVVKDKLQSINDKLDTLNVPLDKVVTNLNNRTKSEVKLAVLREQIDSLDRSGESETLQNTKRQFLTKIQNNLNTAVLLEHEYMKAVAKQSLTVEALKISRSNGLNTSDYGNYLKLKNVYKQQSKELHDMKKDYKERRKTLRNERNQIIKDDTHPNKLEAKKWKKAYKDQPNYAKIQEQSTFTNIKKNHRAESLQIIKDEVRNLVEIKHKDQLKNRMDQNKEAFKKIDDAFNDQKELFAQIQNKNRPVYANSLADLSKHAAISSTVASYANKWKTFDKPADYNPVEQKENRPELIHYSPSIQPKLNDMNMALNRLKHTEDHLVVLEDKLAQLNKHEENAAKIILLRNDNYSNAFDKNSERSNVKNSLNDFKSKSENDISALKEKLNKEIKNTKDTISDEIKNIKEIDKAAEKAYKSDAEANRKEIRELNPRKEAKNEGTDNSKDRIIKILNDADNNYNDMIFTLSQQQAFLKGDDLKDNQRRTAKYTEARKEVFVLLKRLETDTKQNIDVNAPTLDEIRRVSNNKSLPDSAQELLGKIKHDYKQLYEDTIKRQVANQKAERQNQKNHTPRLK